MKIRHLAFGVLSLFAAAFFFAACGGKEVKPLSPESKLVEEAFSVADTLRAAYVRKDLSTIEKNATQEGYRELKAVIKDFSSAELSFTPTWVVTRDSNVDLTVSWKGTWVAHGKTTQERGVAIFVLEGRPLKIARIQRSNPFAQPGSN